MLFVRRNSIAFMTAVIIVVVVIAVSSSSSSVTVVAAAEYQPEKRRRRRTRGYIQQQQQQQQQHQRHEEGAQEQQQQQREGREGEGGRNNRAHRATQVLPHVPVRRGSGSIIGRARKRDNDDNDNDEPGQKTKISVANAFFDATYMQWFDLPKAAANIYFEEKASPAYKATTEAPSDKPIDSSAPSSATTTAAEEKANRHAPTAVANIFFEDKVSPAYNDGSTSNAPSSQSNLPSSVPSASPTEAPTNAPTTTAPTPDPTGGPTITPTIAPSDGPTEVPTDGPTDVPSTDPTAGPTAGPTTTPTIAPSDVPTDGPSTDPTAGPTEGPTNAPTDAPSDVPTTESDAPSKVKSQQPTRKQSSAPTTASAKSKSNTNKSQRGGSSSNKKSSNNGKSGTSNKKSLRPTTRGPTPTTPTRPPPSATKTTKIVVAVPSSISKENVETGIFVESNKAAFAAATRARRHHRRRRLTVSFNLTTAATEIFCTDLTYLVPPEDLDRLDTVMDNVLCYSVEDKITVVGGGTQPEVEEFVELLIAKIESAVTEGTFTRNLGYYSAVVGTPTTPTTGASPIITAQQSMTPSSTPTDGPSTQPSMTPSSTPTDGPSTQPSFNPTTKSLQRESPIITVHSMTPSSFESSSSEPPTFPTNSGSNGTEAMIFVLIGAPNTKTKEELEQNLVDQTLLAILDVEGSDGNDTNDNDNNNDNNNNIRHRSRRQVRKRRHLVTIDGITINAERKETIDCGKVNETIDPSTNTCYAAVITIRTSRGIGNNNDNTTNTNAADELKGIVEQAVRDGTTYNTNILPYVVVLSTELPITNSPSTATNSPAIINSPISMYQRNKNTFARFDVNNDGGITSEELDQVLVSLNVAATTEERTALFYHLSVNGDGRINFQEFVDWYADPTWEAQLTSSPSGSPQTSPSNSPSDSPTAAPSVEPSSVPSDSPSTRSSSNPTTKSLLRDSPIITAQQSMTPSKQEIETELIIRIPTKGQEQREQGELEKEIEP